MLSWVTWYIVTTFSEAVRGLIRCEGRNGIIVTAANGTADTPRAHITNAAALGKLYQIDAKMRVIADGNRRMFSRYRARA